MAALGKPFKSLPLAAQEEVGPPEDVVRLPVLRTAPVGTQNLTGLVQQLANTTQSKKQLGMRRLETFQRVKHALEKRVVPRVTHQQQGSVIGRLATQIKSFAAPNIASYKSRPTPSQERKALLAEFSKQTSGADLVRLQTFKAVMNVKGEEFADRLFKALDAKSAGFVTSEQLIDTLMALKNGTVEEKIAFIWSFTAGKEDCITRSELQSLLKASCSEGHLSADDATLAMLADSFFAKAGKADDETLSLEDFITVLSSRPEIRDSIQFGGVRLKASEDVSKAVEALPRSERLYAKALQALQVENVPLTALIILLILGQIAGFIVGFLENDHGPAFSVFGWSYPVAKGAARAIQVLLIIFPFTIARSLLTYMRATPLHHVLPLDEHLVVHKQLAYHFLLWSVIHTVCHLINGARIADPSRHDGKSASGPPLMSQAQWYSQEVAITGVLLMGIMCMGYLFAVPWPHKSRLASFLRTSKWLNHFEAFYMTHIFMAFSVLVLLIIHPYPGPVVNPKPHRSTTWVYLVAGAAVYILERVARVLRQVVGDTAVVGITLHKGGVTEIRLRKPKSIHSGLKTFNGKAGQYCFLNIPELARFEWHPFSLTSGPNDDYISFHIRSAGDWTRALYKRCDETLIKENSSDALGGGLARVSEQSMDPHMLSKRLVVRVDGPYGAPAQDHSMFSCILLVGAGIGVTPFASVLRQLLDEYNRSLCECCKTANKTLFKPRKVYFFWMTREQSAPQYFRDTLEEIKSADHSNFLEVNIYLTGALPSNDLRTTIAKVAQMIQHEEDGFDAYAGTYQPAPCFFGRPNWPATFARISKENGGSRVGVFVCGPPVLSTQIKGSCVKFNKSISAMEGQEKTKFVFHKENF